MIAKYTNGNANIEIHEDGTRIIQYEGELNLDFPLNIDIRVSTKCSFGLNPKTNKAICSFCHESAKTDGVECDYEVLLSKLEGLPAGIELAIGANEVTYDLVKFLEKCKSQGWICNLTINQGHLVRDIHNVEHLIRNGFIKGLGVSYRGQFTGKQKIPKLITDYEHTVFHVIAGIDDFWEVNSLSLLGVNKILILGEKDFGFNLGKVNLQSNSHLDWRDYLPILIKSFKIVSFDNLAIEQLNVRSLISKENWDTFYQGEHSFYINAVDGYYAPSSRSDKMTPWNTTLQNYFLYLR